MDMRFDDEFEFYAKKHDLDFSLVKGIAMAESTNLITGKLDPYAYRFEEKYEFFNNIKGFARMNSISERSEKALQQSSFGLLQIMGSTARDMSFHGNLLQLAEDHGLAIDLSCKFIVFKKKRYKLMRDLISSYNCGTPVKNSKGIYENEIYVQKVTSYIRDIESI